MEKSALLRIILFGSGGLLALILGTLGVETAMKNFIGWFLVLVGVGYLCGGAIYLISRRSNQVSILREVIGDRTFWWIIPGFLIIFFAPPLEYLYLPEILPRNEFMRDVGLDLIGLSVLLHLWTRLTLKEMYTGHILVRAGNRLVTTGPYRYIRHPGYTGFILMAIGLGVGYSSLIGLIGLILVLVPGLIYRLKVEEKILLEHFGDEYKNFQNKTKHLIPGVW